MRSVSVTELKNRLSGYLRFVKAGEEVIICHRNLPVARLVPVSTEDARELKLVAAGKMRLPEIELDPDEFDKMPIGRVKGGDAIRVLLADREESY